MAKRGNSDDETSLDQSPLSPNGPPPKDGAGGLRASGSGRSRPRASLACMNCRQRKIKCTKPSNAGSNTSCNSCRSLQVPCVISRDGDRRKTGSREQVTALQDRVQMLESLISQNQFPPSASDSNPSANLNSSDYRLPDVFSAENVAAPPPPAMTGRSISARHVENGYRASSQNGEQSSETANNYSRDPVMQPSRQFSHDNGQPYHSDSTGGHHNRFASTSQSGADAAQSDVGRLTPLSEKDSSRLDVDQNFGRPRFYGPTSQPYIQRRSYPDINDVVDTNEEPTIELKMDSAPLRYQLFGTWWKTQLNSVGVVEESFFEAGRRAGGRSEYYSFFLENSLLACATRMSTSEGVRALGAKYADRAKLELAKELEYPNTATLQAFLLLSDFEATRGRDRLGYTYCGIASRLVFDLGLAESCDNLIAQGKLSASEALARHSLFLVSWVFDKLWSLYLGRPSAIPLSMLETAHNRSINAGWSGPPTLEPWVGLCADISEVTDLLNSSTPLKYNAQERLLHLDRQICHHAETLPPSLLLHESQIAELPATAYGYHIQSSGLRIVIHKFLSRSASYEAADAHAAGMPSPQNHTFEQSRLVMYENAVRIARLVSVYQQISGIENMVTVMLDNIYVAGAVLISHVLRLPPNDTSESARRDLQWLRTLADILIKAQQHYPVTARMRSTLSSLIENTSLGGMFGTFTPPNPTPRQPTEELSNEAAQSMARQQDMTFFTDPFTDTSDPVFQDMDIRNMMSWVFSPPADRMGALVQI